ncbi:uncharacterized protein LMH87_008708 [Akanthomyces muscarius]|uniref:Uncharacterized protein n=1 Tax=Akanthomyces muscarius TaxID=2231603 RepID=A0A9W8UNP3_AKAMU|nr:uncharacterized protein LMH87_008708 [Akanthomyces muscarius]KAJ4158169.1 hypothetical protein LMH87_008708 [Akanthomyces muscarius]
MTGLATTALSIPALPAGLVVEANRLPIVKVVEPRGRRRIDKEEKKPKTSYFGANGNEYYMQNIVRMLSSDLPTPRYSAAVEAIYSVTQERQQRRSPVITQPLVFSSGMEAA